MAFKMFLILFWESPTTVLHECNDKKTLLLSDNMHLFLLDLLTDSQMIRDA